MITSISKDVNKQAGTSNSSYHSALLDKDANLQQTNYKQLDMNQLWTYNGANNLRY